MKIVQMNFFRFWVNFLGGLSSSDHFKFGDAISTGRSPGLGARKPTLRTAEGLRRSIAEAKQDPTVRKQQ